MTVANKRAKTISQRQTFLSSYRVVSHAASELKPNKKLKSRRHTRQKLRTKKAGSLPCLFHKSLRLLLSSHDIDNRHDIGDIHLVVTVHISILPSSDTCHLVDDSHDITDIHFAVAVHITLHAFCLA